MYDDVLIVAGESERARRAADHGLAIAGQFGATVHALGVAKFIDKRDRMRTDADAEAAAAVERVARDARERDLAVETTAREGVPHEVILEYIDESGVDIAVMGTRGQSGLRRLVQGSVTEYVIRESPVPVVAVRAADDGRP